MTSAAVATRRPASRRTARGLAAAVAALLLTGCARSVLDPQGPVGANDRTILIDALAIMLAIVVPTIVLALGVAWWQRASNKRARYLPEWAFSGRIEAIVWSIPALTVMFLGGVIWIGCYELDPAKPLPSHTPALEVQVVSLDWKWLFIYPGQGVASVNQLVIPAGQPVHFSITSASVMNTFFVPQLGSMIYAMHGMVTQLNLQADHPGAYFGESTQFSGDGFADMNFTVRSLPPAAFAAWAAAAHGAGPALDLQSYTQLEQQSERVAPYTFSTVQPGVFQAIVGGQTPPGPGPTPEAPAHSGREVTPASES
jgi:cytochrome o ubiquinol oxidase subunit II